MNSRIAGDGRVWVSLEKSITKGSWFAGQPGQTCLR
jgi:hypothetical protein